MATTEASRTEQTMYAASFQASHDCVVGNFSRAHPSLRILHWCVNRQDVFQVSGPEDEMGAFRVWAEGVGRRHSAETANGGMFITDNCACTKGDRPSISDQIVKVGVWDIPPVVYQRGWESWRIIAWDEPSVRELFTAIRGLGELKINSLRPIANGRMEQMMLMPASDVFAGLTARQLQALNLGLDHGYYATPSETDVGKLAQGLGLASSTLAEHLRKAESRVLRNLRPYLQVYTDREAGEVVVGEVRQAPLRLPRRAQRTRRVRSRKKPPSTAFP